jgi:hypothetical protein
MINTATVKMMLLRFGKNIFRVAFAEYAALHAPGAK